MFRREKRAQLTKNIIAESERVIEFGEHASYSLGSTAGCAFRDRFCREPCEVVLDRGNLRIKIGDLPRPSVGVGEQPELGLRSDEG